MRRNTVKKINLSQKKENVPSYEASTAFFNQTAQYIEVEEIIFHFMPISNLWVTLLHTFASVYAEHGGTSITLLHNKLKPLFDQILVKFENFDNQYPNAFTHIKKSLLKNTLNPNTLSTLKKIQHISQAINDFDIDQFVTENTKIFRQNFLVELFDYLDHFYKKNTEILFEFKRIQMAAKNFLTSVKDNPSNINKKLVTSSLIRLHTYFLDVRSGLLSQLEIQESDLKIKINKLTHPNIDKYPLLKFIHDELCERLNFLTESLSLIRQYDQELKILIQNLNPAVALRNPPEIQENQYSLLDLFSQ